MAKEKLNPAVAEEGEESVIKEDALANAGADDEASLSDALMQNPLKLTLIRTVIRLKNHLATIPMLVVVAAMVIITFTIPTHVQACLALHMDDTNALRFFANVLISVLLILAYMKASSRKAEKKGKIIGHSVFFAMAALSLFFDFYFIYDVGIELQLVNSMNSVNASNIPLCTAAVGFTWAHAIVLIIGIVLAAVVPVVQPFFKKLHVEFFKKK